MNNLEKVIEDNKVLEKKEKIFNNKKEIVHLKKLISDLKIHRNVALYASAAEHFAWGEEVHNNLSIMKNISSDPWVQEYIVLKKQLDELENEISDYYYFMQINLREILVDLDDPDVNIYYGVLDDEEVMNNVISAELIDYDPDKTIILPEKELNSKRKLRHFYNKVSFKYLDELSKDNSFNVETKKLGKVKVLSPNRK